MGNKVSLLEMEFKKLSVEEKRAALVVMDIMLKKLHDNGYMVTNFGPNNIYYQDGIYSFDKITSISSIVADNKEEAVLNNVIWMSVVALWAYNSNSSYNLMSPLFVSDNFESFSFWFPEEDREYYKSILVDSYRSGKLVAPISYFSDYVIAKHKNKAGGSNNSLAYIKATEAGKAFSNQEEAAFSHNFFLVTLVASFLVILVGIILYFSIYFG